MSKTTPEWAEEIARRLDGLVALRRDLHRHPELSFEERRTAEIIAERLHAAKLEVRTGVGRTGVVGVLRGDRPGRTIAWRADIDALPLSESLDLPFVSATPGVMHACGHDGRQHCRGRRAWIRRPAGWWGRGRATTRHAFADPMRLGSIRARWVRRRLEGTSRATPPPPPGRPPDPRRFW